MNLLALGIVFFGISLFLILICVNYSWVLWEKDRVDDLTSRIKPSSESDILRKKSDRDYTANFDFRNAGKTGIKSAQSAYEKTLMAIKDNKSPKWLKNIVTAFEDLRSNFWKTIKNFITYLLHLAKPSEYADPNDPRNIEKRNQVKAEIEEEKERVRQTTSNLQAQSNLDYEDEPAEELEALAPVSISKIEKDEVATLDLASKNSNQNADTNSKIEDRILEKLQKSNLTDYNLWLELGNFYVKTDNPKKAREIFNLVMNNTKDANLKDMAVKSLIGL